MEGSPREIRLDVLDAGGVYDWRFSHDSARLAANPSQAQRLQRENSLELAVRVFILIMLGKWQTSLGDLCGLVTWAFGPFLRCLGVRASTVLTPYGKSLERVLKIGLDAG